MPDWEFNNLDDMKRFAKYLSTEFESQGNQKTANQIKQFERVWSYPATEYLGEFRNLLSDVIGESKDLESNIIKNIMKAISAINKAFKQE